jgi:beta-galactosidase
MQKEVQRMSCKTRGHRIIGMLVLSLVALGSAGSVTMAPEAAAHPGWPGPGQLFVGTCYQPVDRSPEEIKRDIALMKDAGFTIVRMGDLSWDSFEPAEGVFKFEWFDSIMDQMHQAGIHVIVDISGLPAPTWLHRKYPSIDLVNQFGSRRYAAMRYMDDISDPEYQRHVIQFADVLTKRYAHHPALIAFGYDNEIGDGYMSYSEADRLRFIEWLKGRYGTIEKLNKAWATQRWSRRLGSFDEVELPYADGPSPPERYLDLRRYWSDVTIEDLEALEKVREKNAPNIPAVSNLYDYSPRKGFDYLSSYKKYVSYGAEGFYPSTPLDTTLGALLTKGDLETPLWFNEFVTGGSSSYGGPKGIVHMWAYLALIDYGQSFLAWTFNTHQGGEEQALFGLLDHDGTPSYKYDEFKQIATEFSKLQHLGFPRYHKPEVAIAYSFDSLIASHPPTFNSVRSYFGPSYHEQIDNALEPFLTDNIDTAVINIAHAKLDYKLLVVPADYVMDEASANAIRHYVEQGGTVLMTAFSAKVDEHSQWFNTPLPGRLSDVFGIRTSQFFRPDVAPEFEFGGKIAKASISFYEVLEPHTAQTLATFTNVPGNPPAVTVNSYGKGKAIYLAAPAQPSLLGPVVRSLYESLGIERGPKTPEGVYARVVEGRTLFVNTTGEDKTIEISGKVQGVLSHRAYEGVVKLGPYGVDLVQ